MAKLTIASAGAKIRAYYLIGECLNRESAASHAAAYKKYVVSEFLNEWGRVGGFTLSDASAKHARQLARKFSRKQLNGELKKGATWTKLRQLSRKA